MKLSSGWGRSLGSFDYRSNGRTPTDCCWTRASSSAGDFDKGLPTALGLLWIEDHRCGGRAAARLPGHFYGWLRQSTADYRIGNFQA